MFGIYKPDSLRSNVENLPDLPSLPRIPLAPYRGSSPKMIRGGPSYILDAVFYLNIITFLGKFSPIRKLRRRKWSKKAR
jgi:hypothetical protein